MRVGLLSGQVFSHFGEVWLAGSHGGRQHYIRDKRLAAAGIQRQNTYHRRTHHPPAYAATATVGGHSELGAAALLKAVWWGMRLASLLTHLL